MENNRLLIIACVIIVLVVGGCAIFFMTSQPAKLNSISYQGIIVNIYSNSLNETVNNDTMFQVIDNDNNIKYTYEVCTGAKSGTKAQELVRQHQGVAYFVGNYTYIVGYATFLNNETGFNSTEIILNVTNGTLIDFNELKDKPVPRTSSSGSSSSNGGLTFTFSPQYGAEMADYIDSNGIQHTVSRDGSIHETYNPRTHEFRDMNGNTYIYD